jgi:hypothetical protein
MSHDDRASDFETRFQERKQELYKCLDEENSKYLEDSGTKHLTDDVKFIFYLVDRIVDQLELSQHYGQGNGEIKISNLFKDSGDIVKATKKVFYIFFKIIKPRVLYFLHVDLSCFYFVACKDRNIDLRMWFESVEESKVLNHFLGNKELEENESEYKIDNTDYCKLIINGSCTNISIDDKDCFEEVSQNKITNNKTQGKNKSREGLVKDSIKSTSIHTDDGIIEIESLRLSILKKYPYKIPENYIDWHDMINIFLYSLIKNIHLCQSFDIKEIVSDVGIAKEATYVSSVQKWMSTQSPVFVITKELIDMLLSVDTNFSESYFNVLLSSIDCIFDNILFLFPKNTVYFYVENNPVDIETNKALGYIDHCFLSRRDTLLQKDSFKNTESFLEGLEKKNLVVNSDNYIEDSYYKVDSLSLSTVSSNGQPLNNTILILENSMVKNNVISNTERFKTFAITKLITQCLLLIVSKPDLAIEEQKNGYTSKRFLLNNKGFGTVKTEKVLYPRVLNLSYAEKKIRSDDNRIQRQGNHSPKSPHWRLGYEVNKPVGKMKGVPREQWERKLIKVAPYFVLGGDDKDNQTTTEA